MLEPVGVRDAQTIVREARSAGVRLRIVGTRSVERFGKRTAEDAELVSMRRMGWIEVTEQDFTVRAGAGVRPADLDAALLPLGLAWPLRRLESTGTVGGLIASGCATTVTAQDGPARRWVLGARLVEGEGHVLTAGGATVKNSVGYGMTHALWGSEGCLGAIVELTLRVRRRRPEDEALDQTLELEALEAAAALVRCEDLAPSTAERAVAGLSGATQAVRSTDGLRAVGCYSERGAAEAAAAELLAQGITAQVAPESRSAIGSVALKTARAALDPAEVFV